MANGYIDMAHLNSYTSTQIKLKSRYVKDILPD